MKFQSRVEMARSYLRNFTCDKHGLEVDGEKQLIWPHINARIPGQTFRTRARDVLHSSAQVRNFACKLYPTGIAPRANMLVAARTTRDLIKLIIKKRRIHVTREILTA